MEDRLEVGLEGTTLLIVAHGNMRAENCFSLNTYLQKYLEETDREPIIYIDLSECNYMDSTFIGLIISLAIKCEKSKAKRLIILNPSEKAKKYLKSLSVFDKITIVNHAEKPQVPTFTLKNSDTAFTDPKNVELIFEVHENLSNISEENRREFHDLISELKRILGKE